MQNEISDNSPRFEYLEKASHYLMQKSEASDSVSVQKSMDSFNSLLARVLARLTEAHTELQKCAVNVSDADYEPKAAGETLLRHHGNLTGAANAGSDTDSSDMEIAAHAYVSGRSQRSSS